MSSTPDMLRSPHNPREWPAYPDIPIFLDNSDQYAATNSYGTTPTTPTTPELLCSTRPTHLSPTYINAQRHSTTEASPTTTIESSSHHSIAFSMPEPPPQTQPPRSHQTIPHSFPTRPRNRPNTISVLVAPPINEKASFNNLSSGLGIINGPSNPPSIEVYVPSGEEDLESSRNIAERIEKRLFQYSISGNIVKRWLLEIISWIFSALCMAAIIFVLAYFKDDPLSKWSSSKWSIVSKVGLTLNSFVSIVSKMAGAALILPVSEALGQLKWSWFQQNSKKMWDFEIFDNASRGPWGSLLLLIRTKGKALAAIGALITLCAMALDPFFQQVVDFPDRWTLQSHVSRVSRITRYQPQTAKIFRGDSLMGSTDKDLSGLLEKFSYGNGTQPVSYGNGTRPDIPLSCPTSNCTWPPYETLGVCSKCADVSEYLSYACLHNTLDWTADTNGGDTPGPDFFPNATMCGYFLNATSANPVLMSGYLYNSSNSTKGEALIMRILPLTTIYDKVLLYNVGSIHFKEYRDTIADVIIVSAADGSAASVYRNEAPVAQECVLSWCVESIKSTYSFGQYDEVILKTTYNTTAGPSPWLTTPSDIPLDNGTDIYYIEDINIKVDENEHTGNTTYYGTSNRTALQIGQSFVEIFPSFYTALNDSAIPLMRFRTNQKGLAWVRQLDFNPWIAPNNVTRHMERLASAMTSLMRSSTSAEMISGLSFSKETYVAVRYEWLTLPLGLLALSFIFLAATIFKSSFEKETVGVVKNSAILTLLYGLPDDARGALTRSASNGTPRAKVKELKVKLNPNMGWRFSGHPFTPFIQRQPLKQPPPGWI